MIPLYTKAEVSTIVDVLKGMQRPDPVQEIKDRAGDLLARAQDTLQLLEDQSRDYFHSMTPDNPDQDELEGLCNLLVESKGFATLHEHVKERIRDVTITTQNGLYRSLGDSTLSIINLQEGLHCYD